MPCRIYKLDFKEKNLNLDRDLNHGSPDHQPGALNEERQAGDLEIRGSNPGPGSNFSLENLIYITLLLVQGSACLTINHEVAVSIPDSSTVLNMD